MMATTTLYGPPLLPLVPCVGGPLHNNAHADVGAQFVVELDGKKWQYEKAQPLFGGSRLRPIYYFLGTVT